MSPTHNPDNSQRSHHANATTSFRKMSRGFMKRASCFLAAAFCIVTMSLATSGQTLIDSFADGDFTASPVWSGDTTVWSIVANSDVAAGATGSNTLRLNVGSGAGTQHLRTQITTSWANEQEWGFFVGRRAQAFTNANQMMIWLYANEADLESATVDGYRLLIGDDTTDDEIRLQSVTNGVGTTILTSSGSIPNGLEDIGFLVRVTRGSTGVFSLFTSTLPIANGTGAIATDIPNATNANISQGTVTNAAFTPAANGYIGVVATHSTGGGARAAVELDQIYMTAGAMFRSGATGNWNAAATWQTSFDGTVWATATSTPSSASNAITVRSPHVVTLTAGISADQLTVDAGGTLNVNTGITLTVDDGTGTDMIVNGTVNVLGTGLIGGSGSFTLSSGGSLGIASAAGITSSGATGSVQVAGTRTYDTGANYTYNGTAAQVTGNGLPLTVNGLAVNNSAGLTLTNSATVSALLTLTSGNISTSGNTLTVGTAGTISGGSATSYVFGTLSKTNLLGTFIFHVGHSATGAYTPLDVANAIGGGNLTVLATDGLHTELSGYANALTEFWSLSEGGTVNADLTFHYLESDVMGTDANFQVFVIEGPGDFTHFPDDANHDVDPGANTFFINNVADVFRLDGSRAAGADGSEAEGLHGGGEQRRSDAALADGLRSTQPWLQHLS